MEEGEKRGRVEKNSMGREVKASVFGRCCMRVKKGIEERERMREKEEGG